MVSSYTRERGCASHRVPCQNGGKYAAESMTLLSHGAPALLDEIHDAILPGHGGSMAMQLRRFLSIIPLICVMPLVLSVAFSAVLLNDPKGFHDIPWGAPLHERSDMVLVEPGDRIKGYELKDSSMKFGEAQVEFVRFFTIDGKFVRVVARYKGSPISKGASALPTGLRVP
jgi:hypothetical protein